MLTFVTKPSLSTILAKVKAICASAADENHLYPYNWYELSVKGPLATVLVPPPETDAKSTLHSIKTTVQWNLSTTDKLGMVVERLSPSWRLSSYHKIVSERAIEVHFSKGIPIIQIRVLFGEEMPWLLAQPTKMCHATTMPSKKK